MDCNVRKMDFYLWHRIQVLTSHVFMSFSLFLGIQSHAQCTFFVISEKPQICSRITKNSFVFNRSRNGIFIWIGRKVLIRSIVSPFDFHSIFYFPNSMHNIHSVFIQERIEYGKCSCSVNSILFPIAFSVLYSAAMNMNMDIWFNRLFEYVCWLIVCFTRFHNTLYSRLSGTFIVRIQAAIDFVYRKYPLYPTPWIVSVMQSYF